VQALLAGRDAGVPAVSSRRDASQCLMAGGQKRYLREAAQLSSEPKQDRSDAVPQVPRRPFGQPGSLVLSPPGAKPRGWIRQRQENAQESTKSALRGAFCASV